METIPRTEVVYQLESSYNSTLSKYYPKVLGYDTRCCVNLRNHSASLRIADIPNRRSVGGEEYPGGLLAYDFRAVA